MQKTSKWSMCQVNSIPRLTLHDQSEARLIWRDSPTYRGKHYRGHWQPLCAILGLVACIAIIIFSGWPAIYLLRARDSLSTKDKLKSKGDLGADVVGAYAGVSACAPCCCCQHRTLTRVTSSPSYSSHCTSGTSSSRVLRSVNSATSR